MPEQRKVERRRTERRVTSPKLSVTLQQIVSTANNFPSLDPLPNWTTIVGGRELPARALVVKAARIAANHPLDSGAAAVILSNLGFEVRYKGATISSDDLPD